MYVCKVGIYTYIQYVEYDSKHIKVLRTSMYGCYLHWPTVTMSPSRTFLKAGEQCTEILRWRLQKRLYLKIRVFSIHVQKWFGYEEKRLIIPVFRNELQIVPSDHNGSLHLITDYNSLCNVYIIEYSF